MEFSVKERMWKNMPEEERDEKVWALYKHRVKVARRMQETYPKDAESMKKGAKTWLMEQI